MNARGRRACKRENSRTDYRSDAQSDQTPHSERPAEFLAGFFRSRDQCIDAFGSKERVHAWVVGGGWWVVGLPTTYLPPLTTSKRSLLSLPLSFGHLLYFFLHGAAGNSRGTLGLGGGFLARGALQLLAFFFVSDVLCVHSSCIPEYFSTIFFKP